MPKLYILVIISFLAFFGTAKADGLVKGVFSETIDGVEHEKVTIFFLSKKGY